MEKKEIAIRPIQKEHTPNILKWRNSKAVVDNFIDKNVLTEEQHLNWLNTKVKSGEVRQFIVTDLSKNVDFASVYLKDCKSKDKKAEIGIFIGEKEYRGKGFGVPSMKLLVDYGFTKLGLNKIYARVLSYNKPSYYMLQQLGFIQDGLLREDVLVNDDKYDVYIMSILKSDWKKYEKEKM